MTNRCLLHICLILLFSTEISSLHCTALYFQQNKLNQDSLELLEKMRGNFPSQCINERTAFKPTQDIVQLPLSQKENVKMTVQGLLQEIFSIFSKNLTQTSWDRSLIDFQNGLHLQIQMLKTCLSAEMEMEITHPRNENLLLTTRLKLKRYFQTIHDFLKEKQYSLCAWEIIRLEIFRCFPVLDMLTKRLEN
uniref:Uncharacterized protein n=1 Tax=Pelusios castaneus TaxID=367368 RepID=A0A8C8RUM4_9SAUR